MINASMSSIPVAGALDGSRPTSDNPTDQAALNSSLSQLFSSMLSGPSVSAGEDSDSDEQEG